MYKMMLVEDEPPILYALKHLIDSGDYGFTVTATALNGRDALLLLDKDIPDVIFTDIQMPFMNGLDLIEEVHKTYPDLNCVILTGHNDFEYAVKALRANTFDYLLKPIQVDQLKSTMQNLIEKLEIKRLHAEHLALCNSVYFDEHNELHAMDFSNVQFYPFIISAGHFSLTLDEHTHPGKSYWEQIDVQHIIGQCIAEKRFWVLNGFSRNEKIVIIGADLKERFLFAAFAEKLRLLFNNDQIPIQIIYREPVQNAIELAKTIKRLRNALGKAIVFGSSGVFFEGHINADEFILSSEFNKRCELLAQHKSIDSFKKDLLLLFKEWEQNHCTQVWIEGLLKEITYKLVEVYNISSKKSEITLEISEMISNANNYKALFENYCQYIQFVFKNLQINASDPISASEIVAHMENYLKNHYAEPFSYKIFNELYGFNETYLSQVFKRLRGITPNKYITKLRMERAKEMIAAQPDQPLKKIAEMLGYEDAFYFSRVFKETVGLSPTEYIKISKI